MEYFQEHGLSVLLARSGGAVWFACRAFGSLWVAEEPALIL